MTGSIHDTYFLCLSIVWFTNIYLYNIQFAEEYTHTSMLSHLLAPTLVNKSVNIGSTGNQIKPNHIISKLTSACNVTTVQDTRAAFLI